MAFVEPGVGGSKGQLFADFDVIQVTLREPFGHNNIVSQPGKLSVGPVFMTPG